MHLEVKTVLLSLSPQSGVPFRQYYEIPLIIAFVALF